MVQTIAFAIRSVDRWVTLRHNKFQTALSCETHIRYDVCYAETAQPNLRSTRRYCKIFCVDLRQLSLFPFNLVDVFGECVTEGRGFHLEEFCCLRFVSVRFFHRPSD